VSAAVAFDSDVASRAQYLERDRAAGVLFFHNERIALFKLRNVQNISLSTIIVFTNIYYNINGDYCK
jgi:hypothetical protein